METTQPLTFNIRIPKEIKMFVEMIEEVYNEIENAEWSKRSDIEIGFIEKNKQKKTEHFFGIWYDLWEQFGFPLGLCLKYRGKAPTEWHEKLRTYISKRYTVGISLKQYESWTCVLFNYSFFEFDKGDDIKKLTSLYLDITKHADALATK